LLVDLDRRNQQINVAGSLVIDAGTASAPTLRARQRCRAMALAARTLALPVSPTYSRWDRVMSFV
jgi:hypothetical protein